MPTDPMHPAAPALKPAWLQQRFPSMLSDLTERRQPPRLTHRPFLAVSLLETAQLDRQGATSYTRDRGTLARTPKNALRELHWLAQWE
jgi:hypothetical protein